MIEGDESRAQPRDARERLRERLRADRHLELAFADVLEANVPSASVVVNATSPVGVSQLDRHAGDRPPRPPPRRACRHPA